jgi:hypothetical protein
MNESSGSTPRPSRAQPQLPEGPAMPFTVHDWGREVHRANQIASWSNAEFIGVAVSLTVDDVEQDGARRW